MVVARKIDKARARGVEVPIPTVCVGNRHTSGCSPRWTTCRRPPAWRAASPAATRHQGDKVKSTGWTGEAQRGRDQCQYLSQHQYPGDRITHGPSEPLIPPIIPRQTPYPAPYTPQRDAKLRRPAWGCAGCQSKPQKAPCRPGEWSICSLSGSPWCRRRSKVANQNLPPPSRCVVARKEAKRRSLSVTISTSAGASISKSRRNADSRYSR